ncbi:MAG: diaminopimelate decarboxylase [Chitinispirillaceae bacterium]|nr:diaminopimelate decarboxylase [Chitinispirillaceae bacterium]
MKHHPQPPLPFTTDSQLSVIARTYGTPLFVHSEESYLRYGREALDIPNAFGLAVRYAMKSNPHSAILKIFDRLGIHIDASSSYEVRRALAAGIAPGKIMLTGQETLQPQHVGELVEKGVIYCCTSLTQLKIYCELFAGSGQGVSIRVNPGLGSGHNNRTNTAGPAASFGIWRDYVPQAIEIASGHGLKITRIHTHVGSGSDWKIWEKAASMTLGIVQEFPDVTIVNLGGGYKIDRMDPEKSIDLQSVFSIIKRDFETFARETGRELYLEIEPGTYLSANSSLLLASVNDLVDTGAHGYRFIKTDASMTELLRPMTYGAQHPIRLLGKSGDTLRNYVVVGCCCESGDIFTVKEGDPETVDTVELPEADIGDTLAIMGAGAYGIAMSAKNYNSRPICAEAMIRSDGSHVLISRRQKLEELWAREFPV